MKRILVVMVASTVAAACGSAAKTPPSTRSTADSATVDGTRSLAQLFEGKFAGVAVTSLNGGTGVKLRIRNARNSDGTDADPLFVIDGLPITPPNGVLTINPNDILKIEVLKDDASTVLWGERGVHGVVKITTKRK